MEDSQGKPVAKKHPAGERLQTVGSKQRGKSHKKKTVKREDLVAKARDDWLSNSGKRIGKNSVEKSTNTKRSKSTASTPSEQPKMVGTSSSGSRSVGSERKRQAMPFSLYSFWHVMLENNYFYWLYDYMTGENDNKLKTMYTLNTLEGEEMIGGKFLVDYRLFPLKSYLGETKCYVQMEGGEMISDEEETQVKRHEKASSDLVEEEGEEARRDPIGLVKLYESHESMETKEERHENRKKVMKGLRIYTGQAKPNEKKWKGWSDDAQKRMGAVVVGEMEDDAKGGTWRNGLTQPIGGYFFREGKC
jgi:hypothetical protein